MRRIKAVIAGIVIVALLGVSISVGLNYVKDMNQTEVMVVSVNSLASDYYTQDTSLDGYITSSVSQTIYQDSDMIVEEILVSQGDSVKKGDKLVTFDMTLVEMELNIAKLKMQKYEQDLSAAEKRLKSLKNGGPIIENVSGSTSYGETEVIEEDVALSAETANGYFLATILPSFFTSVFGDGTEVAEDDFSNSDESISGDISDIESSSGVEDGSSSEDDISSGDEFSSGLIDPPMTATPMPTPTPVAGDGVDLFVPGYTNGIREFSDGEEIFYEVLDWESEPIAGTGTSEDPFIFLCSSANESVTATGSFLNKMAGYSEDGTRIEKEGGYWYQLEFHQNDTVTDYNDRKASCTGYFLVDGCLLSSPINMHAEMEFYVAEASQYEPEVTEIPDYSGGTSSGGSTVTVSRADAIKSQETIIASLKLDIAELSLNITKLERKVNKKEIYSKIDGVVADISGSTTSSSDGSELLKIESDQGYYVSGTVSELLLDQMQEGMTLNCMSYETGSFDAILTDVSEYPVSSGSYWGTGNPNASYYVFSAEIPDQSPGYTNGEWINITLPMSTGEEDSLVLSKAFVRSENGVSFVYKDDNGVLKKQVLSVGGNVDSGYSVLITGGLTREDMIAFPYGDSVVEGAKTREGTVDELYY